MGIDHLYHIIAFVIFTILEKFYNVYGWMTWAFERFDLYDNIVEFLAFCIGNFYIKQACATIGFGYYLHGLAANSPAPNPIDVGMSLEQLFEEKQNSLNDAVMRSSDLDRENAVLRAKVDRLQKELESISKDRYELIHQTCTLQNKLGDFESWPEFREEYDLLATQYEAMKRQRAREEISHEQLLHIAREAKLQLEAAKRAEAMSKEAHAEEVKLIKRHRDEARDQYCTLTADATAPEKRGRGDKKLLEENTRLCLSLQEKENQLAKQTREFDRVQSLTKKRPDEFATQLKTHSARVLTLEEHNKKANNRIAELVEEVRKANEKADEMEGLYMAVAFPDEPESDEYAED